MWQLPIQLRCARLEQILAFHYEQFAGYFFRFKMT
jgi:hypothetical protein